MPKNRRSPPAGNTLIIPDLHAPYHSRRALRFLGDLKRIYNPSRVVAVGDVIDGHTASRYATLSGAKGADDEFRDACEFIRRLAKMFPLLDLCTGNHDDRCEKRAAETGVPTDRVRPLGEVPQLREAIRGWTWHEKLRIAPKIVATHGDGLSGQRPGEAAVLMHRCNVIIGHLHTRFGVEYYSRGEWTNWCLHAGSLADPSSVAMSYAKHHQKKAILGAAVLLEGRHPLPILM